MNIYHRLFVYVRPHLQRLLLSMFCGLLLSGTTTLAALLVKPILDEIFVRHDTTKLLFFPLLILLLYLARGFCQYGHSYLMHSVGQRVVRDIRQHLVEHLLYMPLSYFHRHHSGALLSRVTNDITLVQRAVSGGMNDALRQTLTMLGLIGVAFYRDWVLATFAVLVLPFAALVIMQLGRKLRRLSQQAQEKMGELSALLEEVFSSMKVVKGFSREAYESTRFRRRNTDYYRVTMRAVRADELSAPTIEFLGALGVAAVVFYGGRQVISGVTTPGTFFSFLTAVLMLYEPMRRLSRLNNTLQGALAAAGRVFTVLDTAGERTPETDKRALPRISRNLVFTDVTMRYRPETPLVLRGINLEVTAGEVVALVGMSGAGKTSLVDLIPRFHEPANGRITIDDTDIQSVSLASLRAQIGIVTQDIVLFDDTLRQNILYGNFDASEAQLLAAARAAYAHDFIMHMPQGYDTIVGERGVRLSGGEKQRIAIARALLKNPPILILDEATSSLDSASEQMVQYALQNLMKDRTTLVIAHRLPTVQHADKIVVLHAGTIVEVGRHDELLTRGGHYRRLYDLQFKGQERAWKRH
ncbi:MAG TPA: lipid A export permease/ATP-binding protein MsbA [Candidatus Tectomicrobia bacterium]